MTLTLKTPDNSRVYFDNLLRLRIVELGHDFLGETKSGSGLFGSILRGYGKKENMSVSIPARDEYLRMTTFGQTFVAACIGEHNTGAVSDNAAVSPERTKEQGQ